MDIIHPKMQSSRYLFGVTQNGQKNERNEQILLKPKKVFVSISFKACVKKGHPTNVTNGLGNSKGLRRGTRCSIAGGGFWQDQGSQAAKPDVVTVR